MAKVYPIDIPKRGAAALQKQGIKAPLLIGIVPEYLGYLVFDQGSPTDGIVPRCSPSLVNV